MQIPNFLTSYPALILTLGILYVLRTALTMAAETSPIIAKLLGPLGKRAKRQAARDERDVVMEMFQRDITRLDLALKASEKRVLHMEQEIADRDAYERYRDGWLTVIREELIRQGVEIPPPPLQSRFEWTREHRKATYG